MEKALQLKKKTSIYNVKSINSFVSPNPPGLSSADKVGSGTPLLLGVGFAVSRGDGVAFLRLEDELALDLTVDTFAETVEAGVGVLCAFPPAGADELDEAGVF